MIEKKVVKIIGDDFIGYEHYIIEVQFEQHFYELKLKPITIGIMLIKRKAIMLMIEICKVKFEFNITIN